MCQVCTTTGKMPENTSGLPPWAHLHGHTKFSKGDATSEPKALVRKAFENGQTAIAVTDHGVASSWIQMAKACKEVTEEAQSKAREQGLPEEEIAKIGIKFIPGVEMYETNDRTVQNKAEMDRLGYSTHHFLMLPTDNEGLKNLNRIISDASWNGQFYGRNRTDMDIIKQKGWGKGIIATSACLASRTSRYILDGRYDDAKQFALECDQIFDEFYLELQDNNIKDQYIVNQALIQMSQETGLQLVYTQDYHYVQAGDQDLHDTWICIGRGQEKADPNRQGYDGGPYHLATPCEMYQAVKEGRIPEDAFRNTQVIANKCNVEFDFKKNRFPKYKFVPTGYTADSYLRHVSFQALWDYSLKMHEVGRPINIQVYNQRLDYELSVIADKGYSDYFLILRDVFDFCEQNGILTGPGRGSAMGSLIAFLNKITGGDPVEHGLIFERFLNNERMSAPDVDTDFQHDRREEVFRFIIQRFGEDHVAQIITYGQEKLRSGIDDLCRAMKEIDPNTNEVIAYGQDVADEIKKTIPFKLPDQNDPTYAKMKKLAEDPESFRESFGDQTDKVHQMAVQFMKYMKQYPEIDRGIKFIEGLVRNFGRHAAAVVITDEPITNHIPTYRLNKEDLMPVTAFSMKEIDDDLSMLKLDALSLSTMTILGKAQENINLTNINGARFDIRKIPLDDPDTYKTIRDGHTTGVFQLSGGPITAFTKRVKPWTFNEVVDILALFRPGPLESLIDKEKYGNTTMAEKYIENADQQELQRYMQEIPESLRDIYGSTRGILIYQEQILSLAQRMAGYTMGGADILRRSIGKKDTALLSSLKYEFVYGTEKGIPMLEGQLRKLEAVEEDKQDKKAIETYHKQIKSMEKAIINNKAVPGCVNNGYDEKYSMSTFESIELFSRYSFNRSHSLAYAMVAVWSAYLKTHYPVEFMAAQLTVQSGDTEDTTANILECRRLGIRILPPDINKSKLGFSIELVEALDDEGNKTGKWEKAIRYGLNSIKGVGEAVIQEVMSKPARAEEPDSKGQDYQDIDDFFHRVDKRRVNKSYMEKLIKAGCFDFDIQNRHSLLNYFSFNLRGDKEYLGTYEQFLKDKKAKKIKADTNFRLNPNDYNEDKVCEFEAELFGFYLSYHPYQDLPYQPWHEVFDRQEVDMGGKITKIKKHKTKKGDNMCWLDVETAGGKIEVTVFPRTFTEFQPELFTGNIAIFRGRKQTGDNDKVSLILDKVVKARKKKFKVEKPPELEELAKQRKQGPKKGQQLTLEDLGGPTVKADPVVSMPESPNLSDLFDADHLELINSEGDFQTMNEAWHHHQQVAQVEKRYEKESLDLEGLIRRAAELEQLDGDDFADGGNWISEELRELYLEIEEVKAAIQKKQDQKHLKDVAQNQTVGPIDLADLFE